MWHLIQFDFAIKPLGLRKISLNETYSEGSTVRYLYCVYPSKFCLEQEDVSALFRFKFALVYGIREVPDNWKRLKLNRQLENLLRANDVNLLGENKYTFCEGNEWGALLVTANEVSLLANVELKIGNFHNTEGWGNKCFDWINIWEQH